jgi:hypothetical protein
LGSREVQPKLPSEINVIPYLLYLRYLFGRLVEEERHPAAANSPRRKTKEPEKRLGR